MNKTLLTAAALISALSFSPAVFAQSMIQGKAISDKDLPLVTAYCASLSRQANTDAAKTDMSPSNNGGNENNANGGNANGGNPAGNAATNDNNAGQNAPTQDQADQPIDKALVTSVDLDAVTLGDCTKAGLVK